MEKSPVKAIMMIIVIMLVCVVSLFVLVPMLGLLSSAPDLLTSATTTEEIMPEMLDFYVESSYGSMTEEKAQEIIEWTEYWILRGRYIVIFDEDYNGPGGVYTLILHREDAFTNINAQFVTNTTYSVFTISQSTGFDYSYEFDPDNTIWGDITYPETFHFILGTDV